MTFTAFRLVERTNPTTGEIVQKLVVLASDGKDYTFLTDLTVDDIKARRDEILQKMKLIDTKHGVCAVSDSSKVLEEF